MPDNDEIKIDNLLINFLRLIRDYYHITDKANYFLEGRTGESGINIAITNQRDVLSHLVTLLSEEELSDDDRQAQYANAEEHLRRSIVEPYQRAVELRNAQVGDALDRYIQVAAPLVENGSVKNAPNLTSLNARRRRYLILYEEARGAKHRNLWDEHWNAGVIKFEQAFDLADDLLGDIETTIAQAEAKIEKINEAKRRKRNTAITVSGWVFGLVGLILAVLSILNN